MKRVFLYLAKMADASSALRAKKIPDSLYELCIHNVVKCYNKSNKCYRDELRSLPDTILMDVYFKMYLEKKLCILGVELSSLDTIERLLRFTGSQLRLLQCFQAVIEHGSKLSTELATIYTSRCDAGKHKVEHLINLGLRLGGFLNEAGWYADAERVLQRCREVCQAQPQSTYYKRLTLECCHRLLNTQSSYCCFPAAAETYALSLQLLGCSDSRDESKGGYDEAAPHARAPSRDQACQTDPQMYEDYITSNSRDECKGGYDEAAPHARAPSRDQACQTDPQMYEDYITSDSRDESKGGYDEAAPHARAPSRDQACQTDPQMYEDYITSDSRDESKGGYDQAAPLARAPSRDQACQPDPQMYEDYITSDSRDESKGGYDEAACQTDPQMYEDYITSLENPPPDDAEEVEGGFNVQHQAVSSARSCSCAATTAPRTAGACARSGCWRGTRPCGECTRPCEGVQRAHVRALRLQRRAPLEPARAAAAGEAHARAVSARGRVKEFSALMFVRCDYSAAHRWSLRAQRLLARHTPVRITVEVVRACGKACVVKRLFSAAGVAVRHAVGLARAAWGAQHPRYAGALLDYGFYLLNIDSITHSVAVYEEALGTLRSVFGSRSLHVATAQEDLAYALYVLEYSSGRFYKARDHAERAIHIIENLVPPDHLLLASAKRVKALILEEIALDTPAGQDLSEPSLLEESEALHKAALRLSMMAFGENNVQTAKHYGNLGRLYQSMQKFQDAETMHLKAIAIKEELLGPEDYEVGLSIGHLASLYNYHMNMHVAAETLYLRSIAISLKLFGERYSGLEYDYRGLVNVFTQLKRHERAAHYSRLLQRWHELREQSKAEQQQPALGNEQIVPLSLLREKLFGAND
ncbi:amyloid protein-binding protein 2 [Ostrinia nubilalis]|uniref:amyloid protein-binding protein 2 n=1 Tax=Ostrinia nubilalis TaxID=29057 RepID=UPI00308220EA